MFLYSVVENHLKKENKQVKILVYNVTYIHIMNKFCHDIRHKKNLYRPALVEIANVFCQIRNIKVALNRLSLAAQTNLFQPTRLMSYFRMAQIFASVQLNLRLKSCCDSL